MLCSQIPSLGRLCLDLLFKYMDDIESLGCVTSQIRYQFAERLASVGKLNADAVMRIVEPRMVEMYLPDCKLLEEPVLVTALEQVAR